MQLQKACGKHIRIDGRLIRIARLDTDKYHFLDDPEATLDGLRNCGTRIDLFTFMQRLTDPQPKYQYPMEWDNLAALPVSTFEHWWNQQIGFKARNKAKQAEKKGVVIQEVPFNEFLVRGIWEIYNESPVRQGIPFLHYGKDFATVHREAATYLDSSFFIGAFLEGKLIGFTKLTFDDHQVQANMMHIISMIRHRDKAPTNALIAGAVRSCAARRIPYLVYSNFAYPKKTKSALSDFKARNGFKRVDLPRYYVPLNPLGSVALHLGLHHRMVDRLPELWAEKLRELRKSWYNRRFQSAPEALLD